MASSSEIKITFRNIAGCKFEKVMSDITNIRIRDLLPEIREKLGMMKDDYIKFKFISGGKVFYEDSLLSDISLKAPITVFGQMREFTPDTSGASSSSSTYLVPNSTTPSPPDSTTTTPPSPPDSTTTTPPNSNAPLPPTEPHHEETPEELQALETQSILGFLLLAMADKREFINAYLRNPLSFSLSMMNSRNVNEFIRILQPKLKELRQSMMHPEDPSRSHAIPIPQLNLENTDIQNVILVPMNAPPVNHIPDPAIPHPDELPQHPPNNFTPEDNENIDRLVTLGFPKNEATLAYIRAHGDTNAAANALFESAHFDQEEEH